MRRIAAALVAAVLIASMICELTIPAFRSWCDNHDLTTSAGSSLLVVGVTALIFDEVVARRQRSERSVTVAVQGLILYGQAQRAYTAVKGAEKGQAEDETRSLATMLLVASPPLFEDPDTRRLLEEVQRLAGCIYELKSRPGTSTDALDTARARLGLAARPLAGRLPEADRVVFDSGA